MSQAQQEKPLTRTQIRSIFRRNYGAANQLASDLGVHRVTISQAVRGVGQYSDKIHDAIRERAGLLATREREKGAS